MKDQLFQNRLYQVLGILLAIFIALLILNQINQIRGIPQTMKITATGKVNAIPDMAVVNIGVVSQGTDLIDVKNKNNQKMNQVIAFIKQQGIEDKNIKTSNFNTSPTYRYTNGQSIISGYQASQTITVKVEQIDISQDQLEKIVDGAVLNGANEIQGINFNILDTDNLSQKARKQAVEKAKEKARELTSLADLRLGKIINLTEDNHEYFSPNPMAASVGFASRAKSVAPNLKPGNQEVTSTVTVVFEVR